MNRVSVRTVILSIASCFLVRAVTAAEPGSETENISRRMRMVTIRVQTLSRDLQTLRRRQSAMLRSLEESERALRLVHQRRDVLRIEQERHQGTLLQAIGEEARALGELRVLLEGVRQRLRALYMVRKGGAEDVLVFHSGDRHASLFSQRELVLWRHVLTADKELVDELERKREEVVHHRERLDREQAILEALAGDIESQAAELRKKGEQRSTVLRKNQAMEDRIAHSLHGLRREWYRLEGVLRQLTGGASVDEAEFRGVAPPRLFSVPDRGQKQADVLVPAPSLAVPVIGRIVRPFGKRRVQDFNDFVTSNGVELLVEVGGQVRAFRQGVVRFVGEMPGFGSVVVIDHGDRLYTLSGRLREVLVSEGAAVRQGEPIGVTGVPEERVGNFYFESRHASRPIDPIAELGVPWG